MFNYIIRNINVAFLTSNLYGCNRKASNELIKESTDISTKIKTIYAMELFP